MKPAHPAGPCIVVAEEALRTRIDRDVPPMHIEDHDPLDRLQEAARGHRNTRTWPRVRTIILAKQRDSAFAHAPGYGETRTNHGMIFALIGLPGSSAAGGCLPHPPSGCRVAVGVSF